MDRILAIDFGERRMGLALSDPLGLTAQGLPTAERRNKREDLNFFDMLARRHKVSLIVVGNPLNLDGSEGPQSAKARAFAAELARRVAVAVELWDERLTSVEAHAMLDEARVGRAKRRGRVDQLAATILLQSFLDTRRARDEIRAAPALPALSVAEGSVVEGSEAEGTGTERSPARRSDDLRNSRKRPSTDRNREAKS